MALAFYPHTEDVLRGTLMDRIEVMLEAAGRYKAVVLDVKSQVVLQEETSKKLMTPRDQAAAYNWEAISRVLREIRELPEGTKTDKEKKGGLLAKLAEVYEVLRGAKMPKLEAVRLALMSEADQLRGGTSQVA